VFSRLAPLLLLAGCTSTPAATAALGPAPAYVELADELTAFVEHERADKAIPAVSIALVDDQEIVWAAGFGFEDADRTRPAGPDTVYRVGSVSKLFTAIAVMQLVERGELDLDAPIQAALPGFSVQDPFPEPITLRQIHAHRSGLVREPPVGSYFDPSEPGLAATVESLSDTAAVYAPGERTKYSNAAVSVAGFAVERTVQRPFADHVRTAILEPLGMDSSSFGSEPELEGRLAEALMWTRDGREFPAPTFDLGIEPAGSLYSTAPDLGRFLSMLFADGQGAGGSILAPGSLEAMWQPAWPDAHGLGFGLGFSVGELDGHRTVGHDGAVYGFATVCTALPDERLGVVVCGARDVVNATLDRIAELALRGMLAVRAGRPLPRAEVTDALHPFRARRLAGSWQAEDLWVDLEQQGDELVLSDSAGDFALRVRSLNELPIVDDPLAYGIRMALVDTGLVFAGRTFERTEPTLPAPCPPEWRGLVGEYGWDHNTLFVLEDRGQLVCLIEWFFRYPLEQVDENRFRFPSFGLYHGEELVFERDPETQRATAVTAAGVRFARRQVGEEHGTTFRIEPLHSTEELRRLAAASSPPHETGKRPADLVDLRSFDPYLDPGLRFDVRYATTNNFLGTALYDAPHAYLQRPAAEALARAHGKLVTQGYGLLIHDAFRPWSVTKMFWDATPAAMRAFVADPTQGSRHNRGCAVDLTLYDLETGAPVEMVSGYDEFSPRSSPTYPGGTSRQRWHRELLRQAMESEGFRVYSNEWWHFDYEGWSTYPILESFPE